MGFCEIFARIFIGWIVDKKWIKPKHMFTICFFVSALFAFITPAFESLEYMCVYAAITGIFPASFWSLVSVLVIDVVGMNDFPSAFGLVLLGLAVGVIICQPSIGKYMFYSTLTHLCGMYFPTLINWTSPFPILWLLGGIFHFYLNFQRNFCKQTVENLIRRRILRRLIWFCTVCRCSTKKLIWVKPLYSGNFRKQSQKTGIRMYLFAKIKTFFLQGQKYVLI